MRIETKLLAILNDIKTAGRLTSVTYQSPAKSNVETDTMTAPMAVLYVVTDHKLDLKRNSARETAEVNLFLLNRNTRLDWDGVGATAYIDAMAQVALEVVARVKADTTMRIDSDQLDVRSVFDLNDTNLAGVSLQFTLTELQGQCISIPQPTPTPDEDNTED